MIRPTLRHCADRFSGFFGEFDPLGAKTPKHLEKSVCALSKMGLGQSFRENYVRRVNIGGSAKYSVRNGLVETRFLFYPPLSKPAPISTANKQTDDPYNRDLVIRETF